MRIKGNQLNLLDEQPRRSVEPFHSRHSDAQSVAECAAQNIEGPRTPRIGTIFTRRSRAFDIPAGAALAA
jgi:hypothetical protein